MKTRLLATDQVIAKLHDSGMLDVTKRTVNRWCADGTLPYVVVAKRRRFREDLIDGVISNWIKQAS